MKKLILSLFLGMCALGLFAQSRPVVVIVPFDAKGVNQDEVDIISEVFLSEYTSTGKSTVVDRGSFDKIAAQQKFQLSDWSDSNKVAEMGRALNAHQIITGQIAQFGSQLVCTVKCIDVNTTEVISSTVKRVATMDALFDTCTALSRDIAAKASMSVKEYRIGDKGPAGGIIFAIEGDNRWEVSENLGEYNWEDAFDLYELNGYYDWILPTIEELQTVYEISQKGLISQSGEYWSRTLEKTGWAADGGSSFKTLSFSTGTSNYYKWAKRLNVRLVRKFDIKNNEKVKQPDLPVGEYKASVSLIDLFKTLYNEAGNLKRKSLYTEIMNVVEPKTLNLYLKVSDNGLAECEFEVFFISADVTYSKTDVRKFNCKSQKVEKYSTSLKWKIKRKDDLSLTYSFWSVYGEHWDWTKNYTYYPYSGGPFCEIDLVKKEAKWFFSREPSVGNFCYGSDWIKIEKLTK